jgi:Protein of unknown function (DUF3604)
MPLSTYLADRLGSAVLEPADPVEAGSFQSLTLTYTAGFFGIDDSGSLRIVFRHVSDMGLPQFDEPAAPGYVTAHASNGAVLDLRYDGKLNVRPWDRTLQIRVVRGFLREGDRITVHFGDRSGGSPGIRMQTFCEDRFEFRVLVDAIATCDWVALPASPSIRVVPGKPVRWKAVLPTMRRTGERFRLGLKGEDAWGNPSDACDSEVRLRAGAVEAGSGMRTVAAESGGGVPTVTVDGLPESVRLGPGDFARVIDGLSVSESCELRIDVLGPGGELLARSNPLRIVEPRTTGSMSGPGDSALLPWWGDLHGQSGETIGTNTAHDYFRFARDRAFLDVCCHQGNDFQITNEFWRDLNELTREFNRDEDFVVFPGYEWSGNTALGGDRNVLYLAEGRPIYRSSHALVADLSDADTDAHDARALFERLSNEDALVFAHVGGRYSDIRLAHDGRVEHTVEIHSAWGTFEWLLEDALELGYRVGISANSDGHKGRPGASYPGAATFGAYGGLTCVLATGLTRAAIAESFRRRHHYATTGNRMLLDVRARFGTPAERVAEGGLARQPDVAGETRPGLLSAMMGDIFRFDGDEVDFVVEALGSAPVERIDIRNGRETIETYRPYGNDDLGRRIRVLWEGAEYRGRGRQTIWDGSAHLAGNRFERVEPINFYNLDKRLEHTDAHTLEWASLTTGGFSGFDAWLEDGFRGNLEIETALVKANIPIAEIGGTDLVIEAGGIGRRVRLFRLPDTNPHEKVSIERRIRLRKGHDNALYVRATQEDGHVAWSSPIYIIE